MSNAELIIEKNVVVGIKNINNGTVKITDDVVSVKDFAFEGCAGLKEVDMSEATALTYIGKFAFYNCKELQTVTFGGKIMQIGRSAFQNCISLKKVEMLYGISRIEGWTFAGCTALESVTIPNSVQEIGPQAFAYCYYLRKMLSYSGEIYLNKDVFLHVDMSQCEVEVPLFCVENYRGNTEWNKFKKISEQNKFSYQGILYQLNPETENHGEDDTLWVAENNNVTGEADIIAAVPVGDKYYKVVGIADKAFYENRNLKSVFIPAGITHIGNNAFAKCDNLEEFKVANISAGNFVIKDNALFNSDMTTLIAYPPACKRKTFEIAVTDIISGAFSRMQYLERIRFSEVISDKKILDGAFEDIDKAVKDKCIVYVPKNDSETNMKNCLMNQIGFKHVETGDNTNVEFDCNGFKYRILSAEDYSTGTGEAELVSMLPENTATQITFDKQPTNGPFTYRIVAIGANAFKNKDTLLSVNIPETVTSIGFSAFDGCEKLSSINIPDNISSIEKNTFENCTSLTSISLPDSVTSIGVSAFYGCTSLSSINIPDSVTSIGEGTFYNCTSLSSINIPDNISSIEESTFQNCTSLTSISLPDSVTSIGSSAFAYCTALSKMTIPQSVTDIGANAFYNCSNLKLIDCSALNKMPKIEQISTFGGVTDCYVLVKSLNDFYNDENMEGWNAICSLSHNYIVEVIPCFVIDNINYSVTTPKCVEVAASPNVQGAVTIPQTVSYNGETYSVIEIGSEAFRDNTKITSVKITGSNLTYIRDNAFRDCTGLSSIIIPNTVTDIGANAFCGCAKLATVTITSTSASPSKLSTIGAHAFYQCKALTGVTIPSSVTAIGSHAFDNCVKLATVTITSTSASPSKLSSIGAHAFYQCKALAGITIPSSVTEIGDNAFQGCIALSSVAFASPVNLKTIGNYSFDNCPKLVSIDISGSVESVGDYAFRGCSNLKTFKYSSQTSIGKYPLMNCSSLKMDTICPKFEIDGMSYQITSEPLKTVKITKCTSGNKSIRIAKSISHPFNNVPYDIAEIGDKVFSTQNHPEFKAITSVQIDGNVMKTIGEFAFNGCSALTSLTLPNSVESIGEQAFSGTSINSIPKWKALKILGKQAFQNCKALNTVVLGENLNEIGIQAFSGCGELISISLENTSPVTIKTAAFEGCNKLRQVKFCSTKPPIIASGALSHIAAKGNYSIPKGSENTYKNDAEWNRCFKDWKSE